MLFVNSPLNPGSTARWSSGRSDSSHKPRLSHSEISRFKQKPHLQRLLFLLIFTGPSAVLRHSSCFRKSTVGWVECIVVVNGNWRLWLGNLQSPVTAEDPSQLSHCSSLKTVSREFLGKLSAEPQPTPSFPPSRYCECSTGMLFNPPPIQRPDSSAPVPPFWPRGGSRRTLKINLPHLAIRCQCVASEELSHWSIVWQYL